MIVTTDFDTHRMWVHSPCEHYFTATEEGSRYLQFCGVPAADVSVTGVPIHPVFRTPKDRTACAAKHGLATDRPVVLQMAGGFGVVGPIEPMYEALLRTARPIELVTAVGRNAALKAPPGEAFRRRRATAPACCRSPATSTSTWPRPTWWCPSRAA